MSFGRSKWHSKEIHNKGQQTLAISFPFLRWSQRHRRGSTTDHLGQLWNLTVTNVNLTNDSPALSNQLQTRDKKQQRQSFRTTFSVMMFHRQKHM